MSDAPRHLTTRHVTRILEIVEKDGAVVVGGQAVNLWAEHYLSRDPSLKSLGPFTSKDFDFFRNREAAKSLAAALKGGVLRVPKLDDQTPNESLVTGSIDDRRVDVDFLTNIIGVDDESILTKAVTLARTDQETGSTIQIKVLHPLDCVRSRLANIAVLKRTDDLSINQTRASFFVLRMFIDDLLQSGMTQDAQDCLRDFSYVCVNRSSVIRDQHLDPISILERFRFDDRLDERWRTKNLQASIERLAAKLTKPKPGSNATEPGFGK